MNAIEYIASVKEGQVADPRRDLDSTADMCIAHVLMSLDRRFRLMPDGLRWYRLTHSEYIALLAEWYRVRFATLMTNPHALDW